MKKLLLIALVVGGIAFASAPKTEAGTYFSVGIGFPIGFGYYGGMLSGLLFRLLRRLRILSLHRLLSCPIPITGWDIDITAIGITAIDIMAIALTAGHTTGITAAGFITPAATAKNSGENALSWSHAMRSAQFFYGVSAASRKPSSCRMRVGWRILRSALASIWRMRSRVTWNCRPTSSSVRL